MNAKRKRVKKKSYSGKSIYVEVTDACNLQCRSCTSWTKHGNSYMSLETFRPLLKRIAARGYETMWFYLRGESYLHPKLPDMMEMAKKRGMRTFCPTSFSTPTLSDETYVTKLLKNITRFGFNLDGYDQESLDKYRVGASWDITMNNFETVSRLAETIKPPLGINLRVLMFRYNEQHIKFFQDLVENHKGIKGISYIQPTILGKNVLTRQEATEWLAVNPKFQRYMKIDYRRLPKKWLFRGEIVKRTKDHIWIHKSITRCRSGGPSITVNGEVPCCSQDTDLKHSLGNIFTDTFKTIRINQSKIAAKMYYRQLDICKTRCLCRRQKKGASAEQALSQIQPVK